MHQIVNKAFNLFGFRSKRKLLVFESDDWGTIRMPSKEALQRLVQKNPKVEKDRFARLDGLADVTDLSVLFDTLTKYKDSQGNHPIITANVITANPDFAKIKAANYEEYFYEPFSETIRRKPDGEEILKLWTSGQENGFFYPQLHGREHVHVPLWLAELRNGNPDLLNAFEESCFGIPYCSVLRPDRFKLMQALDRKGVDGEIAFQEQSIVDSARIFEGHFGFTSESFIAPSYHWHRSLEPILKKNGVNFIQGIKFQLESRWPKAKNRKKPHYTGQKNSSEQYYIVRNGFFEPCGQSNIDNVEACLARISGAFKVGAPAVIGTHRINFIGSLQEENRTRNIAAFDELLRRILQNWPDVEFASTDQLGRTISRA